jgi:NitT/TauT family transport system substrate-binding protein
MKANLLLCLLAATALVLGACGPTTTPAPQVIKETVEVPVQQTVQVQQTVEVQVTTTPQPITVVRVSMGYIPNFQYAPFYVALEKGYFAEEGIQIIMDYGTEEDAVKKVASGTTEFGTSSGDSIILARANGIPVKYVMRWYNGWPTCIFSLKEKNITKPEDLVGKTVGLPGPFGANWVAYQALLAKQGIDPKSITVQMIGFTQITAVSEGQVDAAAGYAVNEPLQLQSQGKEVNVINVSDYVNLVPIGMFTSEQYITDHPDIVQKFVRGLLRGINATLAEPDFALEAVIRAVQFSGGDARPGTKAGLEAAMKYWTGAGTYDTTTFQETQDLMVELGMVTQATNVDDMFTNEFVDNAGVTP